MKKNYLFNRDISVDRFLKVKISDFIEELKTRPKRTYHFFH